MSYIMLEGSSRVALVAFQLKMLAPEFEGGAIVIEIFFLQRHDRL